MDASQRAGCGPPTVIVSRLKELPRHLTRSTKGQLNYKSTVQILQYFSNPETSGSDLHHGEFEQECVFPFHVRPNKYNADE